MACKNEQCKCRNWCEVSSDEAKDSMTCEDAKLIASWWKAKISGVRDRNREEDFDESDFEEE